MKEILAILRRSRIQATQRALSEAGFPGATVFDVLGRGKEGGLAYTSTREGGEAQEVSMGFLPKRMLQVAVDDSEVRQVISIITAKNQTGELGDGKVFICPLAQAVRIRTGDRDAAAVR